MEVKDTPSFEETPRDGQWYKLPDAESYIKWDKAANKWQNIEILADGTQIAKYVTFQ